MLHRRLGAHHIVPAPNGMVLDEHFGAAVAGGTGDFSVAHLFAPAGWLEPAQVCQFEEVSLVVSGQLAIETPEGTAIVGPGESCLVPAGVRVQYRNASGQIPCEYWSLCVPAWRPDRVQLVS